MERQWRSDGTQASRVGALALGALSVGFAGVSQLRARMYANGMLPAEQGPVPVISVGNLTVGGTGKTPVVRWIVGLLKDEGYHPGVVLRGYGGDETLLHRRWHEDIPVVEASRRIDGVRQAAHAGADVVVCDDAFQHRALARDLDIVLLSAEDTRRERLLPAGPYREPLSALARADLVLVTEKGRSTDRGTRLVERLGKGVGMPTVQTVSLDSSGWMRLSGVPCDAPKGPVLLVTGVASPDTVRTLVVQELPKTQIDVVTFPDHYAYTDGDALRILERAGSRPIVTTEKDAVKLNEYNQLEDRTWVLGLTVARVDDEGSVRHALRQACSR